MQRACVMLGSVNVNIELPEPEAEVMPGVRWGDVAAFPTPAYWAYQVMARRIERNAIRYRLGTSLKEEVGACLLGGHGIPAKVGVVAFEHLRRHGAFADQPPPAETLLAWLSEPMPMEDRSIRYRFAGQKARYLSAALETLAAEAAPQQSGRILRDWLTKIPGIGFKTASWVARNWLDADDVAILDIHILRAGVLAGFFDAELTVERHYRELEDQFLAFSAGLGVRASELDALMWYEMMASRNSVAQILSAMPESAFKARHAPSRPPANPERPHARQLALIR